VATAGAYRGGGAVARVDSVERPAPRPRTRGFAAPLLVAAVVPWALLTRPQAGIGTMGMAPADCLVMWTATPWPAALPWAGGATLLAAVAPALHRMS
jgi:hypothetical protein